MSDLIKIGIQAKEASKIIRKLSGHERNRCLLAVADALVAQTSRILVANQKDIEKAKQSGMSDTLIDRLSLNESRICAISKGLEQVAALDDPLGEIIQMRTLANGLTVGQKRVPLGVIAIIYEARPNVTADAFGLCFKAGSSVILRGGSEAIHSNIALVEVFQEVVAELGLPAGAVTLLEDTSREKALALMKLRDYVDVLIPRGGAGLIQSVVENSTIPVIETGTGNCHIFIDESADLAKAIAIVINAKTQRPSVCNACETILVHKNIAQSLLPSLCKELTKYNVEIRGDQHVCSMIPGALPADEQDWYTEYLDTIVAIKIVDDLDEAVSHIDKYSTGHSESIVTENYTNSQVFLNEVDSAAVYVNASTRFTDGFELGFGAEIGISTQKLHARGPMGLKELTTTKHIVYGTGQIRK